MIDAAAVTITTGQDTVRTDQGKIGHDMIKIRHLPKILAMTVTAFGKSPVVDILFPVTADTVVALSG